MSRKPEKLMPVRDFIRQVWIMREAQCAYYQDKTQSAFWNMEKCQKKVDQALGFYLEVMDRKQQAKKLEQPVGPDQEQAKQSSLPTLEVHKQGKLLP